MKNKILKNAIILTLITLFSGLLLGMVYEITKEPIAHTKQAAKEKACKTVLDTAETFENIAINKDVAKKVEKDAPGVIINEVFEAKKGADVAGYVVSATDKNGYGGDIQITVGIEKDGTVSGISILEIHETAGLGMRAKEPEFYNQYAGKKTDAFTLDGDGECKIDALSGATITSKAVTGAVNGALSYYKNAWGGAN